MIRQAQQVIPFSQCDRHGLQACKCHPCLQLQLSQAHTMRCLQSIPVQLPSLLQLRQLQCPPVLESSYCCSSGCSASHSSHSCSIQYSSVLQSCLYRKGPSTLPILDTARWQAITLPLCHIKPVGPQAPAGHAHWPSWHKHSAHMTLPRQRREPVEMKLTGKASDSSP